ncbi:MAG: dipeptidase PepE [Bacteroidales bacterium]
MRLLLISNSTNAGEDFLHHPKDNICNFLGSASVKALFVPYAGVMLSPGDYEIKVRNRFRETGHDIISIHHFDNPGEAVENAEAIVVGGGNTFMLAKQLHKFGLVEKIRERVLNGTPYIGWSAGANVACPTICTTNDMPIVEPEGFGAFNLVKFQINPHYLDANPDGHAGETREARISEYTEINRDVYVVGLREGTMLLLENKEIRLIGSRNMRVFRYGSLPVELGPDDDAGFLLR